MVTPNGCYLDKFCTNLRTFQSVIHTFKSICRKSFSHRKEKMSTDFDFMSFLPDDILIPDLKNIVFEYANSHEIELEQIKSLEQQRRKLNQEIEVLKGIVTTKLRKVHIDSIETLKLIVDDDNANHWTFFNWNNYYALYAQSSNELVNILIGKLCITHTSEEIPVLSLRHFSGAYSILTHFSGANDTLLLRAQTSFRWTPI